MVVHALAYGFSIGPRVPWTSLGLVPRRREVAEREVQYYDLGSRSFDRSTSLVGVGICVAYA